MANGIRTIIIRGVFFILLSLYFLVVFGQKSPNLVSFDVNRQAENFSLQWRLSSTNNLSTVIIEKKMADDSFQPIAEYWVNFEGNKECKFKFTDKKVKEKRVQYRLKLITDKGEVEYSDIMPPSINASAIYNRQSASVTLLNKAICENLSLDFQSSERCENLKSLLLLQLQEREVNYL